MEVQLKGVLSKTFAIGQVEKGFFKIPAYCSTFGFLDPLSFIPKPATNLQLTNVRYTNHNTLIVITKPEKCKQH